MSRIFQSLTVAILFIFSSLAAAGDESPAKPALRAVLVKSKRIDDKFLADWKAKGANAIVVTLDRESKKTWAKTAESVARAGLELHAWIEVARDPELADAHPDWLASIGKIHDDWRVRFADAPKTPNREDVIKAWPWVVIGYEPGFEAQTQKVQALLNDLPGNVRSVFLNDLQAGPSSCGCGNDQCRWALDYGSPATAAVSKPIDDVATRFLAQLDSKYPKLTIIPVWATECEDIDLPNAKNGTGYCGKVACATGTCWPVYVKQWKPLVSGNPTRPIALAAWSETFRRDPKTYPTSDLQLFMSPPRDVEKLPTARTIVVIEAWKEKIDLDALIRQAEASPLRGWVLAIDPIDQSWKPKYMNTKK